MTIRAVIGRGWGQGAQHSKSVHSILSHIPGLKVLMPTTSQDAYSHLLAAHADPNPVLVIEHRWLYDVKGDLDPSKKYKIGKSEIKRKGKDGTLVSASWMTIEAFHAANILKDFGFDLEVIDVGSIAPLDEETIISSVNKTGQLIVADYDWVRSGFASEVAAMVAEKCFSHLKYPIKRCGFSDFPCPTARTLENEFYANAEDIVRQFFEARKLATPDLSKYSFYSYEDQFKGPF